MHKQAQLAHEAAQCALAQDKFWEYHDKLFENQRALGPDDLKKYAAELSMNTDEFNACVDSGRFRDQVNADMQVGAQAGVTGTPAFFVNGRFLNGAQPFQAFQEVIDDELRRNNAR